MRVWPNIIMRITDGSAMIAATPIQLPIWVKPSTRSTCASGSLLHTSASEPTQAAAMAGVPGSSGRPSAPSIGCAPTEPAAPYPTSR